KLGLPHSLAKSFPFEAYTSVIIPNFSYIKSLTWSAFSSFGINSCNNIKLSSSKLMSTLVFLFTVLDQVFALNDDGWVGLPCVIPIAPVPPTDRYTNFWFVFLLTSC